MTLTELDHWLREFLALSSLEAMDASRNGLQVSRRSAEVRKVAFAVDACGESFRRAVLWGADMLFVHHGIIWDSLQRIEGALYERLRFLMENDLALYAAHLPLDMHPEVGNNIGMARQLELGDVQPFGAHRGVKIGCKGVLPSPMDLEAVVRKLTSAQGEHVRTLPFGPDTVRTVGIVSGRAPGDVAQAIAEGLDLFITGEPSHDIYHHCLEAKIHVIFAGHYQSETYGVRCLADRLSRETGLETSFLDIPTGL